ncbi:MAG: HAMP domain-containing protein [Anaerolineales bacterium]
MKTEILRKLMARFWELAGGVNVRIKIMGIVLGGTILLSLSLMYQVHHALTAIMEKDLVSQGISIGRDLAVRSTDLILLNDPYALNRLLLETQRNNSDIRYAFVIDLYGNVAAHTFGAGFPVGLIDVNEADPQSYQNTVQLQTQDGRVWDIAVPIFEGRAGSVRVGISDQRIQRALFDMTSQVLLTTVVVLGLSLLAATFLTFILTRPILDLVEAARSIGQGDFSRRVRRWANDEIGDLADAFNQMSAGLERANEGRLERELLRRQLFERVLTAQEEERRRIARELHDSTSQSLTSLMVGLRTLESDCDSPQVLQHSRQLRQVAAQVLEDVHNLALQLRPAVLDDLGLSAALERLAKEWQSRHSVQTSVIVQLGSERLPEQLETTLYRSIQEALTNVARHAAARSASVLVERRQTDIVAIIEDDGQGFDSEQVQRDGHLGLLGIRERAELLGGNLTIESSPGHGTSLYIQLPLVDQTIRESMIQESNISH